MSNPRARRPDPTDQDDLIAAPATAPAEMAVVHESTALCPASATHLHKVLH